jgi:hypothetical protein
MGIAAERAVWVHVSMASARVRSLLPLTGTRRAATLTAISLNAASRRHKRLSKKKLGLN